MDEERRESVSGIEIPPATFEIAEDLARTVRALAASLPFGAEPLDFLVALERQAQEDEA